MDNEGQSTAGIPSRKSATLATGPLVEGAKVNGLVPVVETTHRGEDTVRDAAVKAGAALVQSLAAVDHHLPASDH